MKNKSYKNFYHKLIFCTSFSTRCHWFYVPISKNIDGCRLVLFFQAIKNPVLLSFYSLYTGMCMHRHTKIFIWYSIFFHTITRKGYHFSFANMVKLFINFWWVCSRISKLGHQGLSLSIYVTQDQSQRFSTFLPFFKSRKSNADGSKWKIIIYPILTL